MKKTLSIVLALVMVLSLCSFASAEDYSGYTIRIYSNSNSTERTTWLINEAKDAGFTISIDDNSVISGDTAAIQAANENKDGDILFGLNETRWSQVVNGTYENLSSSWTGTPDLGRRSGRIQVSRQGLRPGHPERADALPQRRAGHQRRPKLHFEHWADIVNCGYTWYRQNKVGGTTNANINSAMLYPFTDPTSPAGGISVEGWKTLWAYCAGGKYAAAMTTSTASIL